MNTKMTNLSWRKALLACVFLVAMVTILENVFSSNLDAVVQQREQVYAVAASKASAEPFEIQDESTYRRESLLVGPNNSLPIQKPATTGNLSLAQKSLSLQKDSTIIRELGFLHM
jgi:hypothetical protein